MNLFEVQERLKDFSKSQLVNEMQRPSGMAPQYLVLSELQRRGRMEKAFAAEQAKQGSQSTVAQDAVNAAGMPQGGLAQMAQAMAPKTDMTQNTARMFGGGNVGARGESDRKRIDLPQGTTGQDILNFVKQDPNAILGAATGSNPFGSMLEFIATGMSDAAGQQAAGPSQQLLAQQMNTGTTDSRMAALERYKNLYPVQGMAEGGEVRRMDVGGRATGLAAINRNLAGFMPMRRGARGNRFMNLTPDAMGAGIAVDALIADPRVQAAATASNMSPEEYISALNSEQFQNALDMLNTPVENAPLRDEGRISDEEFMASRYDGPGGAYSVTERTGVPGRARLSEAGLTGVESTPTVSAEDIRRMANADRRDDSADAFSVLGAGVAGPYTDFLERMAETPLFAGQEPDPFRSIPEDINRARFADIPTGTLPANEGRLRTPDSTYDEVMAQRRNVYGSDDPYALPADRGVRTDVSGPGFQTDVFIPADEFARGLGTTDIGGAIDALPVDPARIPDSTYDEVMAQRRNVYGSDDPYALPTDRAVRTGTGAIAEGSIPNYPARPVFISPEEFAAGLGTTDFGDNDPYSLPAEVAIEAELERQREAAPSFEAEAVAADTENAIVDAVRADREGAGGAGGGGGAGGRSDTDRMLEQDKWLALAQFGLGLMSSQAPTIGQAIGESGIAALGSLRKAQQQAIENRQAEELLDIRRAAAAASGTRRSSVTPGNLISLRNSIIEEIAGLGGLDGTLNAADLERRDQLAQSLAQIDSVLGIGGAAGGSGSINLSSVAAE